MNFFEHQQRARRSTGRLVLLFILAVLVIVAAVDIVIVAVIAGAGEGAMADWRIIAIASAATIFVIAGGSLAKLAELGGGGRLIAERLGGRLVTANTTDAMERRLLNVVDEMAIASGIPAPPVYVMDEEASINAFAAGFSPNDAVIGVTRGTLELLARDELQGVIAHEFSHILNGDMRLNLRLIGVLHGILMLTLIGNMIFRVAAHSGAGRRRGKNEGAAVLAAILIGLALMLIGAVGSFFGSLIRASVSRQREYLADASSVEITRNPYGLERALKRIGGLAHKAYIDNENAAEAAHMFFGEAVRIGLSSMFASHPPLAKRIRRIEPSWDGKYIASDHKPPELLQERIEARRTERRQSAASVAAAVALACGVTDEHLQRAAALFHAIPAPLRESASDPFAARAVVCALLLSKNGTIRGKQMSALLRTGDRALAQLVERFTPPALALDQSARLPLLDIAIPALRTLSARQLEAFDRQVRALVEADGRLGVFEWVLQRILRHSLAEAQSPSRVRITHYSLERLAEPCAALLSCIAYAGHNSTESAAMAFSAGWRRLGLSPREILPVDECGLLVLDGALDALGSVAPRAKQSLIEAAAVCIVHDRTVTADEGELLRAVSEALDVPMPPVLPGQALV